MQDLGGGGKRVNKKERVVSDLDVEEQTWALIVTNRKNRYNTLKRHIGEGADKMVDKVIILESIFTITFGSGAVYVYSEVKVVRM
jgi:hypothetical protein